jgi:hypothetical protein
VPRCEEKKALWWLMGLVDDVIFGLDGMGWDGMGWFHDGSSPEACRWMTSSLSLWGKNPRKKP